MLLLSTNTIKLNLSIVLTTTSLLLLIEGVSAQETWGYQPNAEICTLPPDNIHDDCVSQDLAPVSFRVIGSSTMGEVCPFFKPSDCDYNTAVNTGQYIPNYSFKGTIENCGGSLRPSAGINSLLTVVPSQDLLTYCSTNGYNTPPPTSVFTQVFCSDTSNPLEPDGILGDTCGLQADEYSLGEFFLVCGYQFIVTQGSIMFWSTASKQDTCDKFQLCDALSPKCGGTIQDYVVNLPCGNADWCTNEPLIDIVTSDSPPSESTQSQSSSGSVTGDPHIKTWGDGHHVYDFMGSCDLVMTKSEKFDNGNGLEVHIRTQIRNDWSYITAVAIRIGNEILEVSSSGEYYLNGIPNADLFSEKLSGHKIIWKTTRIKSGLNFQQFVTHLNNNDHNERLIIEVKNGLLDVSFEGITSLNLGDAVGLMGSFKDGGKLIGRDGSTIFGDFDLYGMEWQVRDTEDSILFNSIVVDDDESIIPQYPNQCRMPDKVPQSLEERRSRMLRGGGNGDDNKSKLFVIEAEKECALYWPKNMIDSCIYDVLATGDLTMAIRDV